MALMEFMKLMEPAQLMEGLIFIELIYLITSYHWQTGSNYILITKITHNYITAINPEMNYCSLVGQEPQD